ncbi:zinc ribbon domain-containing protein [Okeania sp. SIO2C9]|uniref:zinc ribbon domain-containing protein n=1 Tax=Okeania sp. SIO2C9 TaxID=2607791 RepID=UPI0035C88912
MKECGHVQDMPLNIRNYDCPECGLSMDRDLNASINLTKNSEKSRVLLVGNVVWESDYVII